MTAAPVNADPRQVEALAEIAVAHRRRLRPSDYWPHKPPFRFAVWAPAFHKSTHIYRTLFLGNRSGKTTESVVELAWLITGTHRWGQTLTGPPPYTVIWICPEFRQFELKRDELEAEVFGTLPKYYDQAGKTRYEWPDGSAFWIFSGDRDWSYMSGIHPHAIGVDEQCGLALWREARRRGFGPRRTRYVIAATAHDAESWMADEFYWPWLHHHMREYGCGAEEAEARGLVEQKHPEIFCVPQGGIADNPWAQENPAEIERWYGQTWESAQAKKVGDFGGFQIGAPDAVFDPSALEWAREAGKVEEAKHGPGRVVTLTIGGPR